MSILPLVYRSIPTNQQDLPQWVETLVFFGPILLGVAYIIYVKIGESRWKRGTFPAKLPMTRGNYLEAHICLAAYLIQRDRNALKEKVGFLTHYFQRHFRSEYYDFHQSLKSSYEYPITPVSVAKWVVSKNVSPAVRKQLMIFLIQFCGIDGLIIDKEYILLKQIAATLGFSESDFQSLLRDFGPKRPETPTSFSSKETLRERFSKTLGVSVDASKQVIKKAYRDLAKKHHPDKFINASEATRHSNQARFIAVQEAYDYLNGLD